MGLTRTETLFLPVGELMDLIAVDQIKMDGFNRKKTLEEEQAEFFELLSWK